MCKFGFCAECDLSQPILPGELNALPSSLIFFHCQETKFEETRIQPFVSPRLTNPTSHNKHWPSGRDLIWEAPIRQIMAAAVSLKRGRLRRHKETAVRRPRIRIILARVYMDSFDAAGDEEGDDGSAVAGPADRRLDHDDAGYDRLLRERRRRHFTRLYVEQLYRFEEA
ncbi:hypothetical protein IF1G_00043 [Cordyceps javanica]|uniref:Uncharacterized protein n=1 Tax=Cordyceps javanica TaxID=43265 RepID=A0A545VEG4_9HYPO|nr:hypothetical protein IF1G_00043 [Cordyceps javanica]TQW11310.1 hypothetical protein IF2G_00041 [Cordyceps javanica]